MLLTEQMKMFQLGTDCEGINIVKLVNAFCGYTIVIAKLNSYARNHANHNWSRVCSCALAIVSD